MITHNGKTQHLAAWARELGIPQNTLSRRISRHGVEKALGMKHTPIVRNNHGKTYTFEGKTLTLKEWAKRKKIKLATLCARLNAYGMSFEEAISFRR